MLHQARGESRGGEEFRGELRREGGKGREGSCGVQGREGPGGERVYAGRAVSRQVVRTSSHREESGRRGK